MRKLWHSLLISSVFAALLDPLPADVCPMPDYLRDHPVYYAGPAKTPQGYASGSFGPTTAVIDVSI